MTAAVIALAALVVVLALALVVALIALRMASDDQCDALDRRDQALDQLADTRADLESTNDNLTNALNRVVELEAEVAELAPPPSFEDWRKAHTEGAARLRARWADDDGPDVIDRTAAGRAVFGDDFGFSLAPGARDGRPLRLVDGEIVEADVECDQHEWADATEYGDDPSVTRRVCIGCGLREDVQR